MLMADKVIGCLRGTNMQNEPFRGISVPVIVLISSWILFVVVSFSDAGSGMLPCLVMVYGSWIWVLIWLVRLIVSLVRQHRGSSPHQPLSPRVLYWSLEPVALGLCGVLAFSGVLYQVRFRLCRPALEAYAADVVAARVQPHGYGTPKRWVGLFRVAETELQPGGVVRLITAVDGFDDAGFTFSPVAPPLRLGEDSYQHMVGGWYHWHRSW